MPFEKGLHEVADGVWAYLQPDGGWGWSNAGLITDGDAPRCWSTRSSTCSSRPRCWPPCAGSHPRPTRWTVVVNTHANGDHCFGNSLVASAEIIASVACAREMVALAPDQRLADLMRAAPGPG